MIILHQIIYEYIFAWKSYNQYNDNTCTVFYLQDILPDSEINVDVHEYMSGCSSSFSINQTYLVTGTHAHTRAPC